MNILFLSPYTSLVSMQLYFYLKELDKYNDLTKDNIVWKYY